MNRFELDKEKRDKENAQSLRSIADSLKWLVALIKQEREMTEDEVKKGGHHEG